MASALLQKMVYQLAFIDFDKGKEIAQQFASQMRVQDTAIIYTSTLPDRSDLPTALGEYKLLSKPCSINELRNMLIEEAEKAAANHPIASVAVFSPWQGDCARGSINEQPISDQSFTNLVMFVFAKRLTGKNSSVTRLPTSRGARPHVV